MNFTFLKTLLILNFLICLFSCKAKSVTDSTKAKSAESSINTKNLSKQNNKSKHQDSEIKATFQIESSENEELGSPFSKISVKLNDKLIFIKDIQGEATEFNKDDFKNHQIPEDALAACGAWWAGGGIYFYLIIKDNSVHVYEGYLDEEQEDDSYHWKKFKVLK
jgi:hypothetical protein